jgi:hypothetical protein
MICASKCLAQNETNRLEVAMTNDAARLSVSVKPGHQLSFRTTEIVRLAQSGIDEIVMLAFIKNSEAFNLTTDQIGYLDGLGVATKVSEAMLQHDRKLAFGRNASLASTEPPSIIESDRTSADSGVAELNQSALADAARNGALSRVPSSVPVTQLATSPQVASQISAPVNPAVNMELRPPPSKKKPLYPVREPYPVELTAPIVFFEPPSF